MQARMIFYLRCAVCYRLLPRTRTQNQRAQTHSRRRNYARYDDENQSTALPWRFASSFVLFTQWHYAARAYTGLQKCTLCARAKTQMRVKL